MLPPGCRPVAGFFCWEVFLMDIAQIAAVKPPRLSPGATIGIVSPASPFNKDRLDQGIAILQDMGFGVRLAEGVFETEGYLAGSDARRVDQVHRMFDDDTVDAVMCARGGYGSLRLLSQLDYDLIRSNPKPFIGFSDITTLHQAFFGKTGLVTFHGPMICTLQHNDASSLHLLRDALVKDQPIRLRADTPLAVRSGRGQGVLMGGNLSNLCHMIGTPYAANYQGCILFIEEIGEAPYRIDRMLTQMRLAGYFRDLAGLVLGTFTDCGPPEEIPGLVERLFSDIDIPILAGVAVGHGDRNLTLPLGLPAMMDAEAGELVLMECATV